MHDTTLADAARPVRVSILGLPMRDYSIGHEILLWRSENSFVTHTESGFDQLPEQKQKTDLFDALFTCERSWVDNFTPVRFPCLFGWTRRHADFEAAYKAFRQYRGLGSLSIKTINMPRSNGGHYHYFGAPEAARLFLFVLDKNLHTANGIESPYDFPFGLARILYLTQIESEGGIWVENQHDRETQVRREMFEKKNPDSGPAIGEEACQAAAEKWNKDHPDCPVPLMRPEKGSDA